MVLSVFPGVFIPEEAGGVGGKWSGETTSWHTDTLEDLFEHVSE
jgi:hypothetical protein